MGKTVVITGANRGIGLAMASYCQQRGDEVYAVCRHSSAALDALSVQVIAGIDLTTDEGVALLRAALSVISIDMLINNAGILRADNFTDIDFDEVRLQFETNALAPLRVCHALKAQLHPGSKIALISSRMGSIGDNSSGNHYGYRLSKAALNAAGKTLAIDFNAEHIPVGIYHPGFVQTDMVNHQGDISAAEAAQRLIGLIDALSMADSGVFKHSNGEQLPW